MGGPAPPSLGAKLQQPETELTECQWTRPGSERAVPSVPLGGRQVGLGIDIQRFGDDANARRRRQRLGGPGPVFP
jgi:hypothetical protein